MAVKGEEAPGTAPADAGAQPSPRRSELDLTKRNVGPVWRQYLRAMGPGLVTGASDDDPSGIATYSQAGAQYGLAFLWTALLTLPLMAAVQEICDRRPGHRHGHHPAPTGCAGTQHRVTFGLGIGSGPSGMSRHAASLTMSYCMARSERRPRRRAET